MKNMDVWKLLLQIAELAGVRATVYNHNKIMTPAQANILSLVYEHNEAGIMTKDLARLLQITPGAVSQSVDSLVNMGMVQRIPLEHDRRGILLRLTDDGVEICEHALDRFSKILDETLAGFTPGERATIARGLKQLNTNLSSLQVSGATTI